MRKTKPPQFGLRTLFKLTTCAAVLSALYAVLPQQVVVGMALVMAGAAALLVAQIVLIVPVLILCEHTWQSVRRFIVRPRFESSDLQ